VEADVNERQRCEAAPPGQGPVGGPDSYVESGDVRAWIRHGIHLSALAPPDGDPDRLLAAPAARLVKDQRKVTVGMTRAFAAGGFQPGSGILYVKRYNVFSRRVRIASLWQRSPALRAWHATRLLTRAGFRTAIPVAAVEYRRWGMLTKSFFLTVDVDGARPADQYWWELQRASRSDRRNFIRALARLFAGLHAAGVYHNDLKDANLLVRRGPGGDECFLLDVECVTQSSGVPHRRRVKNLAQLHRTLGRLANMRENLYFLHDYLEKEAAPGAAGAAEVRRRWRRAVCAQARRKDLRHALRGVSEWRVPRSER